MVLLAPLAAAFLIVCWLVLRSLGDLAAAKAMKYVVITLGAVWGLHAIGLLLAVAVATIERMDDENRER